MGLKLIHVDDILWMGFKKKCFDKGTSMKDQLTNLIISYMEEDN